MFAVACGEEAGKRRGPGEELSTGERERETGEVQEALVEDVA